MIVYLLKVINKLNKISNIMTNIMLLEFFISTAVIRLYT